jgi:hypothetical protein
LPFTASMISSMGFLSATIIKNYLSVLFYLGVQEKAAAHGHLFNLRCTAAARRCHAHFLTITGRFFFFGPLYWIRAQFQYTFMHLFGEFHEKRGFTGRQIVHLDPVAANTNGLKNLLDLLYPFSCPKITFIEMAIAFHAPHRIHTVGPFFKRP